MNLGNISEHTHRLNLHGAICLCNRCAIRLLPRLVCRCPRGVVCFNRALSLAYLVTCEEVICQGVVHDSAPQRRDIS